MTRRLVADLRVTDRVHAAFTAEPGEVLAVIGPNGAGKSSLLHALAGLVDVDGTAHLGGSDLLGLPVRERRVGLVFQGQGDGMFNAYAAGTGKRLWRFDGHMGIVGAPIAYTVKGRQQITVLAGWGGSGAGFMGSMAAQYGWVARRHVNRVLTFVLDGKARLPKDLPAPGPETPIDDPAFSVDRLKAERGATLYSSTCMACHGSGVVAAGYAPDLRASPVPLSQDLFKQIVHDGLLLEQGMPTYAELTDGQLEELRHFIRARARETRAPQGKSVGRDQP